MVQPYGEGNLNDVFALGIEFRKKSMKLFSEFYKSDIVLASTMGLKKVIGEDKKYDADFLSSVELVIVDSLETINMQNIEHLQFCLEQLNLKPVEQRDADINRVQMHHIEKKSCEFRQLVFLSQITTPVLNSTFLKNSKNITGKSFVKLNYDTKKWVSKIKVPGLVLMFKKLNSKKDGVLQSQSNLRLKYFSEKLLKDIKSRSQSGVLIFLPDHFDYIRVKNLMNKRMKIDPGDNFAELNEYDSVTKRKNQRRMFSKDDGIEAKCLLFTERYYFYHRKFPPRGSVKNVVFYGLPSFDRYFYDMCSCVEPGEQAFVHVMFFENEFEQLARLVGKAKALEMVKGGGDKENWFFHSS